MYPIEYTILMSTKRYSQWAQLLGGGYAHVQHVFDKVIEYGLRKMQSVDSDDVIDVSEAEVPTLLKKVVGGLKGAIGFVGETGKAYYEKYEELKKR